MSPAVLLALLPLIEALLKEAPSLIGDIKNIIAAIEGKPTLSVSGVNPAAIMADEDSKLSAGK